MPTLKPDTSAPYLCLNPTLTAAEKAKRAEQTYKTAKAIVKLMVFSAILGFLLALRK